MTLLSIFLKKILKVHVFYDKIHALFIFLMDGL